MAIHVDEWLAELERLDKRQDEGMTTRELCAAWGLGHCAVRDRLHKAREMGWLHTGRRDALGIDGRPCRQYVYRIAKPKEAVCPSPSRRRTK